MAKISSDEEVVNHYGLVRLRAVGSGNLKLKLFSLDDVESSDRVSIALQARNNIEPTELFNFTQQKAKLQIATTEIDEYFVISKIIIFVKPVAKSYPG